MLLFREYSNLDLIKINEQVLNFWIKNNTFKESVNINKDSFSYIFYEGPPSVNGKPGVHHILSKTIKDIICRYHSLKGEKVIRNAGWDAHGLPIELTIEKKYNIKKKDIGNKISIRDYNNLCNKLVHQYIPYWVNILKKMGFWLDTDNAYLTSCSKYIETVWYLFKYLYNNNLIYKSYSVQPYSPVAGTGLSSHELNIPGTYKLVISKSVIVQFLLDFSTIPSILKEYKKNSIFMLAWTTTPWTLPANSALAINKFLHYVLIVTYNIYHKGKIYIILCKDLVNNVLHDDIFKKVESEFLLNKYHHNSSFFNNHIPYLVLKKFKGSNLLKSKYNRIFDWGHDKKCKNFKILHSNHVNILEGTGIVHLAPTFGIDDNIVCKKNKIKPILCYNKNNELVPIVDLEGKYINNLDNCFSGRYIKNEFIRSDSELNNLPSVDEDIINFLKRKKFIFNTFDYKHKYPHCWRTNKPLIYYPLSCWFLKTSYYKDVMVKLNKKINWIPQEIGKSKFKNWLKNINDWNLSRTRFWGTPIPIWTTKDETEKIVIGSIKELILEINKSINLGFMHKNPFDRFNFDDFSDLNYSSIDLHRENIDDIILVSKKGLPMKRENDILDVWFDSGCMPYASIHYPFENKKLIYDNINFPADFIAEGVDQTRGWFYTLHAISSLLFKSIAFKNVVSNGLVLDIKGNKMSKSKGNSINPLDLLKNYSPDVIRWYMVSNSNTWENLKFNIGHILEIEKKFFHTLYNVYSFFALYANIDFFVYSEKNLISNHILDIWIISELNILIKKVIYNYDNYNINNVVNDIKYFVIRNLSNWYIRLSRHRFWKKKYDKDKISAYQTLYTCLINISKISSPISPFFMDRLYQDLNNTTHIEKFNSVHLCRFPIYIENLINKDLSHNMFLSQKIVSLTLSLRKKCNIKVRQPLNKLIIIINNINFIKNISNFKELILKEINVKSINIYNFFNNPFDVQKKVKVNYSILGPRLGRKVKYLAKAFNLLSNKDVKEFENKGYYNFYYQNKVFKILITEVNFVISDIAGWVYNIHKDIAVFLDIKLNDELVQEGFLRDIINKLQFLRKKNKFNITEYIYIYIYCESELINFFKSKENIILRESLSKAIFFNIEKDLTDKVVFYKFNKYKIGFYLKSFN